jgi:type I restriction-modification system DNA methylase subunit
LKKHQSPGKFIFEKTPTYYKTLSSAKRIAQMNPDIKSIMIVCDNVKRTLSRYLHIRNLEARSGNSGKKKQKVDDLGETFEEFSKNLNQTIDELNGEIMELYYFRLFSYLLLSKLRRR